MLVLSRRETDSIRFPDLGITIEVLKVKGRSAKIGIDAPIEIKVVRGELEDESQVVSKQVVISDKSEHDVRNKLNSLTIAIAVAEKHIKAKRPELAANVLDKALNRLETDDADSKVENVSESTIAPVEDNADKSLGHALLVEDSANERTMLAGLLRLHGYKVDTVGDGAEALNYLEDNENPDFILMDMCMPNLDGASAIRAIRKCPAFDNIEIYAVSGETANSVGLDVNSNRVAQWFQKPLEPLALLSTINRKASPVNQN